MSLPKDFKSKKKKPFGCKIGRHSWIKDELKAIMTCKFCGAMKMMGQHIDSIRVKPWGERKTRCKLGFHLLPHYADDDDDDNWGIYYCELCGEMVEKKRKPGFSGGG